MKNINILDLASRGSLVELLNNNLKTLRGNIVRPLLNGFSYFSGSDINDHNSIEILISVHVPLFFFTQW